MPGWPFDGAPKRVKLPSDLYDHAKAGEVRIATPQPVRTLDTQLADLARLTKAGHADYDFDRPLRMVGADRGEIEGARELRDDGSA